MAVGFGLLWWIHNKRWKPALGLILLGITHVALVFGAVMPAFSPSGEHLMLGKGLGQLSRYFWLGDSMKEVFQALVFHPITVARVVLLELGGAKYLLIIMLCFLGFPLAAPEFLLPGLADLMANILSANPMPRSLFAYHSVSLVPVLIAAAIYGTARISRWNRKFSAIELTGLVLIASVTGGYLSAPLPLPGARNFWKPVHFLNLPDPMVHTIRSAIGEQASVSAQANIGAHFSQCREIYRYPDKVSEADFIILRLKSPTTNINNLPDELKSQRRYFSRMLDSHLQMDRTEYIASIEHLLSNNEYGISYWNDPWLVFKRGLTVHGHYKQIEDKLNQLRKEWKINSKEDVTLNLEPST